MEKKEKGALPPLLLLLATLPSGAKAKRGTWFRPCVSQTYGTITPADSRLREQSPRTQGMKTQD